MLSTRSNNDNDNKKSITIISVFAMIQRALTRTMSTKHIFKRRIMFSNGEKVFLYDDKTTYDYLIRLLLPGIINSWTV